MDADLNLWKSEEHVLKYLGMADAIPRRAEGEEALLECLPRGLQRVVDLGSGDGRLLARVLGASPSASAVAIEFSPVMLERLKARFDGHAGVQIVDRDLNLPLPPLGSVDAVISSFAIHHVSDTRKRELYGEVFDLLEPGGVFCNLEHVSSPTQRLHEAFLATLGVKPSDDDPSNKLVDVGTQLAWLRDLGFEDVDCHWKWRELALLAGVKPRA
jgi:tRNA (cmo5U34)-methyltransferase